MDQTKIDEKSPDLEQVAANHGILLFDGVCNLCNGFVQFVIKRDRKGYFKFASLQSDVGKELLEKHDLPVEEISTVVLIEGGKPYTHSDVGLRVARELGGAWPLFYVFIIVPRFIRDAVYKWIARNRYRWFGKKEACWLPTPDLKARFLD